MKKTGKVYLVGAGPGDPGLFTLRGAALLEKAEVVVVDNLVNPALLQNVKGKIIHVGKRGPAAPGGRFLQATQKQITSMLVRLGRQGKTVVRLKGGDPIVFGRGSEEMDALVKSRVRFEIVPGVTSATAVPAYAGIPISDRRLSSKITLLTGHEGKSSADHYATIDWTKLYPNQTLVILMGVTRWPFIRQSLLSSKWPPSKPVCAIENGTRRTQRVIRTNLKESEKIFKKKKLSSPAIIVVGDVARLGGRFDWMKKEKPLLGKTIVVTRAENQAASLISALQEHGAAALAVPSIEIKPLLNDPMVIRTVDLLRNGSFSPDWIIFLSQNAVKAFALLFGRRTFSKSVRVCAVGPRTSEEVKRHGWPVHRQPKNFNALAAARALGPVKGKFIFVPRGKGAPDDFLRAMEKRGARVQNLEVYENTPAAPPSRAVLDHLETGVDAVTFTSGSTVRAFMSFFSPAKRRKIFKSAVAVSIGPMTSAWLKKFGVRRIWESRPSTTDGMISLLIRKMKSK